MIRLLKSYIFWSYERGSIQYDFMVTAILLFIFVGPRFIDFKDKPVATVPIRSSEVLVKSSSADGKRFTYEVRTDDLESTASDADIRRSLLSVIEPISGDVTIERYQPIQDTHGKTIAYDTTVRR